jgi:hypothetical protein
LKDPKGDADAWVQIANADHIVQNLLIENLGCVSTQESQGYYIHYCEKANEREIHGCLRVIVQEFDKSQLAMMLLIHKRLRTLNNLQSLTIEG